MRCNLMQHFQQNRRNPAPRLGYQSQQKMASPEILPAVSIDMQKSA